MSEWRLVWSSLFHYRWVNLSVLVGVALTSAILSGALVVGDSVEESLRRNAAARISDIGPALVAGERHVTAALADRVTGALEGEPVVAPILQAEGTAASRQGGRRVNRVQLVGVDERFWDLSLAGEAPGGFDDDRWIGVNRALADRIGAGAGDTLIVRTELPGALSKDAPLSGESEQTTPFTAEISTVVDSDHLGLFSLRAEQVPPATIFVKRSRLEQVLELPGLANVLAAEEGVEAGRFAEVAQASWNLEDLRLEVSEVGDGISQLIGARVFLDGAVVDGVKGIASASAPALTYLATDIRSGERATPYSMVTGTGAALNDLVGDSLPADGIVLSRWIADDLQAEKGDEVTLVYDVVGRGRELVERQRTFEVAAIRPLKENGWNRSWTPEFPGILDVESLGDWEPGIPIDRDRIRDEDDAYWDEYRATPKAFVTLAAARDMWSNRFGDATAVRFRLGEGGGSFVEQLRGQVALPDLGMAYRNLPAEADAAVSNSFDFGSLFASMSFFLIVAALVLAALVFVFGIEQRSGQIGLLLALGFTRRWIRRLLLAEAFVLAVAGALLGLLGGWVYTRLALYGMSGVWRDAAAGIEFIYHLAPGSLAIAFLVTVVVSLAVVWFASRRAAAVQPSHLISGADEAGIAATSKGRWDWIALVAGLVGGLGCLFAPKVEGSMAEQGLFFGAGFCLTVAGVAICSMLIRRFLRPSAVLESLGALGRQHTVRRRGRSLAVIGLMAAGVFMVTAINSFRLHGERGAERRGSGTGGFAWVGKSTLPVYEDLDEPGGRETYGLQDFEQEFSVTSFRVSDGTDASCLNLNRAQRPRLMGVDAARLAELSPFTFTGSLESVDAEGWSMLEAQLESGEDGVPVVPGIVDQNTAIYALKKGIGDRVVYETISGRTFAVEIVGFLDTSILQGSLIVSEVDYLRFFPNAGGYRFFLLDGAGVEALEPVARQLTRLLGDRGLEMRPAAERLDEFNAVQNTYLSIFSTLGGLGIFLGTVGLAVIVGRNVLERRGQLGVMQAMGFTRRMLARMVLSEHWFLHVSGVLLGLVTALVAVTPQLAKAATRLPWGLLAGINGAILLGGLVFCAIAARVVLRTPLMEAIRRE